MTVLIERCYNSIDCNDFAIVRIVGPSLGMDGEHMASRAQLVSLHRRMMEAQRELIGQAAGADTLPTRKALSQIADLEQAMLAVEPMSEEQKPRNVEQGEAERLEAAE